MRKRRVIIKNRGPLAASTRRDQTIPGGGVEPIAIIGIGCRFPGGADGPEGFWRLLSTGVDAVGEVPRNRWDAKRFYHPNPEAAGRMYSRWGGFLENIDEFDAAFFGISPREASRMDPQHRILLEVACEALEDAGQGLESLRGDRIGVYIGIASHDYADIQTSASNRDLINAYTNLGGALSVAANRISYVFDLQGPSVAIDTACSSSLVAVHLACRCIWDEGCRMALAGGVNVILSPETTIGFSKASMLSPTGKCRSFDAYADGYVRGEGAGVVILKPLSRAVADGDCIYALIRGSAVNQDGNTNGITVPNGTAQKAVIEAACRLAGLSAAQVQYVEAHGTGTLVGDPIEARALGAVLGDVRAPGSECLLGSVKSNIGHLEPAAGIAGLVKVALALRHREIPPSLHFETPNPKIPFDQLRLRVPRAIEPWPENQAGHRIAGVNSFGFGGTNAHAILVSAPESPGRQAGLHAIQETDRGPASPGSGCHLLPLSARSEAALQSLAQAYRTLLLGEGEGRASLSDISYSASLRRSHHMHRVALAAESKAEVLDGLQAFLDGESRPGLSTGSVSPGVSPKVVFVYSGMGQQWWAMGRELIEGEAIFRDAIGECDALLQEHTDWSLMQELLADEGGSRINETRIAQPAIFALQVALSRLWQSWGIVPDAIVGHSVGEIAAAHVAGALSLSDAVRVIFHRSRLQARTAGHGTMLAVGLPSDEAVGLIKGREGSVSLGAVNSPRSATLSGDRGVLEEIARGLEKQEIFCRFLRVDVPYHSPLMENLKAELIASLEGIQPQHPDIPYYSTVTGTVSADSDLRPTYWAENMRQPVLFARAIEGLLQAGHSLFLEIGAHPVLSTSITECVSHAGRQGAVLPSLRRQEPERRRLLGSLGRLYTLGWPVDWPRLYPEGGTFVKLPAYPWQRERYWNESEESRKCRLGNDDLHPLLGARLDSAHTTWDASIDLQRLSYLGDHRIYGEVVCPAGAYLEMALAAARDVHGSGTWVLEDVKLEKALVLQEGEPVQIQVTSDDAENLFSIYSRAGKTTQSWIRHASGHLGLLPAGKAPATLSLQRLREQCRKEVTAQECYQRFDRVGLQYGPQFRGLGRIWSGDGESLGQLQIPPGLEQDIQDYVFHPALLDAAFQVLFAAFSSVDRAYLPVGITRLRVYSRPTPLLWAYGRKLNESPGSLEGDVQILDHDGTAVAEIKGLRLQAIEGMSDTSGFVGDDHLYEYRWKPEPHAGRSSHVEADWLPSPETIAPSLQKEAARLGSQLDRPHFYEMIRPQLDRLAVAYIRQALNQLGAHTHAGQPVAKERLADQLGISFQHRRLFHRMMEIVEEARGLPVVSDSHGLWRELMARWPGYLAELTLIRRCGEQLARVLRDEVDPLSLMFPQGDLSVAEHMYQGSPTLRIYNTLVQQAVVRLLEHLPRSERIRILELGAGTGGVTSHVLPVLPAQRAEYLVTDVSNQFTSYAKERFSQYPFAEYALLDIEQEPSAQGFQPHSFHLILAGSVLHATRDLRNSLEQIKRLLASEGWIALIEQTAPPSWYDIVFGLLKGWWRFSDLDLRPAHPTLPARTWSRCLQELGFQQVQVINETEQSEDAEGSLIIAGGPPVEPEAVSAPVLQPSTRGAWLLLSDQKGTGENLAALLGALEERVVVAVAGEEFEPCSESHYRLRPDKKEDIRQLIQMVTATHSSIRGVVYLWSLDTPPLLDSAGSIAPTHTVSCNSALYLVQSLDELVREDRPRLWLVTRGVQCVGDDRSVSLEQSPLWGLGRVIANEYPGLRACLVDLSAQREREEMARLVEELLGEEQSEELALRGSARYVHRLQRVALSEITRIKPAAPEPDGQSFRLAQSRSGILGSLKFAETVRTPPGPGEVEIRVHASGLNFKDVVVATGLLPREAFRTGYIRDRLGLECAGEITSLGEGVRNFEIGDFVTGCGRECFAQYVTTDARFVVPKPAFINFEEAATIPAAFVTAVYALHHLARIRKGERVLLHSAAGGVGLAAVQLARRAGAEVFATAGTPEKRDLLRSLGVAHVMDSRSLTFADEVTDLTDGEGVDIVLNSLTGPAIPRSIELLRSYGRFIEIGKADIYANRKIGLRSFGRQLSYFVVDIDAMMQERPDLVASLLREAMQLVDDRILYPLPHRVFPVSDAPHALRQMTKGRHVGKLVLSLAAPRPTLTPSRDDSFMVRPDGAYLITGGLGGFGLATARWLVEHGARSLILVGRSGASSSESVEMVRNLRETGADVRIIKADVADGRAVEGIMGEIRGSMPPLRGIIHAAMVLDDALLSDLNEVRMQKVMAPKIMGAWNLHVQSSAFPLDFFVLFSSVASTVGNPGQGNYVAANTFLDALAQYRRLQGLPGLSVNWGVIEDVGYVARRMDGGKQFEQFGVKGLPCREAMRLLEALLSRQAVQVAVASIDWRRFAQRQTAGVPARFSDLVAAPDVGAADGIGGAAIAGKAALAITNPAERLASVEAYLTERASKVLGTSPGKLDLRQPLTNLGVDSLMAVELSNVLKLELGVDLSSMKILGGMSIGQMAAYLCDHVTPGQPRRRESTSAGDIPAGMARTEPLHTVSSGSDAEMVEGLL